MSDINLEIVEEVLNLELPEPEVVVVELAAGQRGPAGLSAYEIAVQEGFVGSEAAWLLSLQGSDGQDGDSAYQVAVNNGFVGNEAAWLASLIGPPGPKGDPGNDGADGLGVPAGGLTGQILAKTSDNDNETAWIDPPVVTGNAFAIAGYDLNGDLYSVPSFNVNQYGGTSLFVEAAPNNDGGGSLALINSNINPLQDSDNETWNVQNLQGNLDTNSDGFSLGRNGTALQLSNWYITHHGLSDVGGLAFVNSYYNIGNGTDPISVKGLAYMFGFANINEGVTVDGPIQGYIFQPTVDEDAFLTSYGVAFGDFANFQTPIGGHASFIASPLLAGVENNSNYTAFQNNANITELFGNAGYTGMGIFPTIGKINTGRFQGVAIAPTIADAGNQYVVGLTVSMNNVTGTNKKAAQFDGDVGINGDLNFTGQLAIGQLQAFYESNPVASMTGDPQILHGLVSSMVALDSTTTANADAIGVNTAMLITMQENAIVTSGPFQLGFAAMALPCVVETHAGSNIDYMSAATYAMNLVGSSTGGTIQNLNIGRAVVIPNGITQVDNIRGWLYQEPFGPPGTNRWGVYEEPGVHNFFAGDLKIGDGGDIADSGYKLHVQGGGFLLEDSSVLIDAFDNKIGFFGSTPVVQQSSSGAVSAGGAYTATEQNMIQEMYNALRAYGLLT